MRGPTDPTNEFSEVLQDPSTPALLRRALEMFMAADPKLARDAADKLDELCERRLAMVRTEVEKADVTGARPDGTELNDRCDALTGRLMKYLGKLVAEQEHTEDLSWFSLSRRDFSSAQVPACLAWRKD